MRVHCAVVVVCDVACCYDVIIDTSLMSFFTPLGFVWLRSALRKCSEARLAKALASDGLPAKLKSTDSQPSDKRTLLIMLWFAYTAMLGHVYGL